MLRYTLSTNSRNAFSRGYMILLNKTSLNARTSSTVWKSQANLRSMSTLKTEGPGGSPKYTKLYHESINNPEVFWRNAAIQQLDWNKPFTKVDESDISIGKVKWYSDGELNASWNCVDRHAVKHPNRVAIIWEADTPGENLKITYSELLKQVSRLANVLIANGVKKGDRVTIYLPMSPMVIYSMLACSRIGAVHSVVFAGFGEDALRSRIVDADSSVVITADHGLRGGKLTYLKKTVDGAIHPLTTVKTVLVSERLTKDIHMQAGRDKWLEVEMKNAKETCAPVSMNAEDPLFLLYTSGSTGKPKGLVHTTGGYLTYASLTHKHVFNYNPGDIYCCAADCGWITGHSYITYGPLVNGATMVLFESVPNFPTPGRYWEMIEKHKINQFYTSPTALRSLLKAGDAHVHRFDLSSLRVLGSVGEPINVEAWKWYNDVIGKGKCTVVDTWWQTETGGAMITPLPGDKDLQPGAATRPFFGVLPVLLDEKGKEIEGNDRSGILAIKKATPGMARTIFGSHERYVETYFKPFPGYYFTGDGALRDSKGHIWITGRVDDVINVSGHRLGTAEVEDALQSHTSVAEAAVVGYNHEIKGQGIYCFVVLKDGVKDSESNLISTLKVLVRQEIGPFASPDVIHISATGLPKTRSGKVMRRILRKIASNEFSELGDTSTLAEPSVVDDLIAKHKALHGNSKNNSK